MTNPTTIRPRTVDVPTAAKLLGVPRGSLYRLIRNDECQIPHLTIGTRLRFSIGDLAEFLRVEPDEILRAVEGSDAS